MNITLTPSAHAWIYDCIENRNKTTKTAGIRFGVRTTGCSGLAYTIEFENNDGISGDGSPDFIVGDCSHGRLVMIYVSKKDAVYLGGSVVDYVTEDLNSGLKFLNPNEAGQCGCGESFTV